MSVMTILVRLGHSMGFQLQQSAFWLFAFISLTSFLSVGQADSGDHNSASPNLILIMTDEHNFRTLGCYREMMEKRQAYMWGPAVVETPNIDWLADQGALCTSFYATTPVCSPSRGSLISGLYPQATPVVTNNIPLNDEVITFAHLLGKAGYQTGFAGKWHLDGSGKPQWAPERKFGFQDNRFMFNRGHWKNLKIGEDGPKVGATSKNTPSYAVGDADEKTFTTDFLMDRTLEFIDANKSVPFCYMLSLPDPHGPDTVRAPYDTMYADQVYEKPTTYDVDDRAIPEWGEPAKKLGFGQSKYYGMVKCIDDNIGRLLKKLTDDGILDNTMIVFTSDHGDLRGEHHRQNKGVPWEGSARIPFLVFYPSKIKPKTVVNQALTSVDFCPTLFSLFETDANADFHGRDFSSLLTQTAGDDWDDVAFARGTGDIAGWLMAVSDRHKLVVATSDQPWLFDLKRDPDEMINMLDNPGYRDTARELAIKLKEYGVKYQDPRMESPRIKADLGWLINGKGAYSTPQITSPRKKKRKD
ncbi:MAG: sulfatase [Planctomycetaceae bacterium]|nr:sulfatase [Planctomycetaceae bacterium]